MRTRYRHVSAAMLLSCWLFAFLAWASDNGLLKVEPDRPDVSNSTLTVPVRALQVELGLEYARSHNEATERRLAVQTTLRTGLGDRVEVRLDGEPLVRLKEASDDIGLGDIAVGLKYRV
ncbi:MAG: transporter, partial [Candidatus Tectomicrobia bacterium]|nr:transporter [Candidatus Tectomicrobia bacterium]